MRYRLVGEPRIEKPRIIFYHQTQYHNNSFISLLPTLTENTGVTHVYIAAIHINSPDSITLNDDPCTAPKLTPLWEEVRTLQAGGIKVMGMQGGAAQGSFTVLDGGIELFDAHYTLLRQLLEWTGLDGLDLDVEEAMSLPSAIRLIDRLKEDFGRDFLITLAPVAAAMLGQRNLSGFDYEALEKAFAHKIAWYNTQFYCNWGCMKSPADYDKIIALGWPPSKIVAGLVTNLVNCTGWVGDDELRATLTALVGKYPTFGGVVGWEYFNAMTEAEGEGKPWCWAKFMTSILRPSTLDG